MPRHSFQKRRKKPRISYQQNNAQIVKRNKTRKQSKISRIAPDYTKQSDNDKSIKNKAKNPLTDDQIQERMWKMVQVSEKNAIDAPLVISSFATKYAEHRESYIRITQNKLRKLLQKYGIALEMDFQQHSITVSTTNKTWDPYSIIKARDLTRLLSRYVPFEQAAKVMKDSVFSDIIEIGKTNVARNQQRFIKRRARIIGPNGVTLRAIELLTKCYILVYGRTVAVIGDMKGIHKVHKIVIDCMNNIHPIYQLKRLMVEQELASNSELRKEEWNRFLPVFKKMKRNSKSLRSRGSLTLNEIKKKQMRKKRNHKRYTPWPPPPVLSKIDIAMESGAYWNKEWRKENLKRMNSEMKFQKFQVEKEQRFKKNYQSFKKLRKTMKQKQRLERFQPPEEISSKFVKNRLRNAHKNDGEMNMKQMERNVQQIEKLSKIHQNSDVNSFLMV